MNNVIDLKCKPRETIALRCGNCYGAEFSIVKDPRFECLLVICDGCSYINGELYEETVE